MPENVTLEQFSICDELPGSILKRCQLSDVDVEGIE